VNPRLVLAVIAGKTAAAVTRRIGRGGGTALPGLVAEKLDPAIVRELGSQLGRGTVLITGTNGKTTTSRILASIATEAGLPHLHNREGSNLMRGIASSMLAVAGASGTVPGGSGMLGIIETDEATLPPATRALAPRVIAFTNLFRDQLDRYGEVDTVAALWREALSFAPADATLVLNADDPSVAELAIGWTGPVHWFGLDDLAFATEGGGASDARWCRNCGGKFAYETRYFSHIGIWRCGGCERRRPTPQTSATNVRLGIDEARFTVPGLGEATMALTGAYNVYNALAAVTVARVLGIDDAKIRTGLAAAQAAFGRQEVVDLEGRRLRLLLAKNPAGANQVLRLLSGLEGQLNVGVLLSDRFADGQDVSWTWDVDFELLAGRIQKCWAGGTRAEDIALRLKYAGWPAPGAVAKSYRWLVDALLAGTEPGCDIFLIPTYTSLLDLRAELQRRGAASAFWERSK
jgi:UDP-N-acetylmuramyl tripeptide synthase